MNHKIPKNIINHKNYTSEHTSIVQIRPRSLTARQSLKNILRENGHSFKQELFYYMVQENTKYRPLQNCAWQL